MNNTLGIHSAFDVYQALVDMGAKPALTWYSSQGRMELSGAVVANHCAKIASFLAEEVWVDAGERARLSLPCHWKSVLWALGAMLAGLQVEIADEELSQEVAVAVTNHPEKIADNTMAREIVALDMNPLTFGWTGEQLPEGVFDGSAGQLSQPDVLVDVERHTLSNFKQWSRGQLSEADRALFASASLEDVLRCACLQFSRGGSLVVAPPSCTVPSAEGADPVSLTL